MLCDVAHTVLPCVYFISSILKILGAIWESQALVSQPLSDFEFHHKHTRLQHKHIGEAALLPQGHTRFLHKHTRYRRGPPPDQAGRRLHRTGGTPSYGAGRCL